METPQEVDRQDLLVVLVVEEEQIIALHHQHTVVELEVKEILVELVLLIHLAPVGVVVQVVRDHQDLLDLLVVLDYKYQ